MKMSESSTGYYGYPQYTLVGGSPRGSQSGKNFLSTCPLTRLLVIAISVITIGGAGYLIWPAEPGIDVRRIKLDGISIQYDDSDKRSVLPAIHLDVNLKLDLLITNRNFFGANYDKVVAHIKYRGDELGQVESTGGKIPARSTVSAVAALDLQGKELFQHVPELLVDVANRELPLDVVAVFFGAVEVLFFDKYEEVTVSCEMLIDPKDKVVLSQHCNLV
ncbi:hypothetical protein Mapa_001610 [Marchantia paleacea]|nr:hypothetical protein Mapa_001610 [Marchantia paleacea]